MLELVDRLGSGSSVHYARKGSSPFPGILFSIRSQSVEKTHPDSEHEDKYVAFPGGIPKKWLDPAFYSFVIVFIGYTSWVISGEILAGRKAGTPPLEIAESIVTHLAAFTVLLTIIIIVCCKGLERIMYYLDAKRLAEQERQRAEQAEKRAEQAEKRAEQERQRAERAERLLEQVKKNKS